MLSLTDLLMRTRSFQACVVSTTSRGASGLVSHSGAYSEQNSSQPIGARALAPTAMNSGRSLAAFAHGATMPAANAATANPAPSISVGLHFIARPPCLFLERP